MFLSSDNIQAFAVSGRKVTAFFRQSLILLCLTTVACLSATACLAATVSANPASLAPSLPPSLKASTTQSADGTITLSWSTSGSWSTAGAGVELQQAVGDGQFQTLYQGNDSASVITGLSNGNYRYRLRQQAADGSVSAWSQTLEVNVIHHPLSRALGFFAVGVIVFVATLLMILLGSRRHPSSASS